MVRCIEGIKVDVSSTLHLPLNCVKSWLLKGHMWQCPILLQNSALNTSHYAQGLSHRARQGCLTPHKVLTLRINVMNGSIMILDYMFYILEIVDAGAQRKLLYSSVPKV